MLINTDENIIELKKYFKKLIEVIEHEVVFNFGNKKFFNNSRIDDVLCCIEATYPTDLKTLYKRVPNKIIGYKTFLKLSNSIRTPFFLNNNLYVINYKDTIGNIQFILTTIERDFKYLQSE